MAYRVELPLSRIVTRGEAITLTLPVRDDDDLVQTATGGTITIYLGSKTLLAATAITSAGPPASYVLAASVTTDEALSDEWVEVWKLDGLDTFTVRGYLVRRPYHTRVTEQGLLDKHPELVEQLPPGENSGIRFRRSASQTTQRKLISEGRRPWLIFDADQLYEQEVYRALSLWARDHYVRQVGGVEWLELAQKYEDKADALWEKAVFGYDEDEDGLLTADEDATPASSAGVVLTAGRPGGWRYGPRGTGGGWR